MGPPLGAILAVAFGRGKDVVLRDFCCRLDAEGPVCKWYVEKKDLACPGFKEKRLI